MILRHWVAPALVFAAFVAWWLFPVLSHPSSVIPGAGAGDNITFVWNVWWMRYVLHHPGHTFFFTPFLFHPIGADLTLHTHTALPALIGSLWSSPIAGQNAVVAMHLYLNFVCSYALAHRLTRRVLPSAAAATIFGTSAFVSAHLNGHFNLIAVWTLPLACVLTLRVIENASWIGAVLLAVALAATAYSDYYLFVYASVLVVLLWIAPAVDVTIRTAPFTRARRRVLLALAALAAIDVLIIAAILLTPADRVDVGPIHISLRSVRNPVTAAWMLLLVAGSIALSARLRLNINLRLLSPTRRLAVTVASLTVVLLLPLLTHAGALWRAGTYVSQTYLWRSGPAGVDAATLALGGPFHATWGEGVRALYSRFQIDVIEASAWVPLSALLLVAVAIAFRRDGRSIAPWLFTGPIFLVWALGPWLTVFGHQTPIVLPAILVRFVPIVANARMPGRAIVVVYLVVAVLAAIGLDRLLSGNGRTRAAAWCLIAMLVIECLPSRPPLYVPAISPQYSALRNQAATGAICELPLGLRDGFDEIGSFDSAVLLHQMIHERPIVGGFIARLPPGITQTYQRMPVIQSLLRLSSGTDPVAQDLTLTPTQAANALASSGIAFIILDTRRASAALIEYVRSNIELRQIAEEDGRVFYEVMSRPNHSEGVRPSDSPTRSLAGVPQAPLRSRGLTRALVRHSHEP